MTQKNILIIIAILWAFCFLISSVYWFVRFMIIKKHLPRLNEDNRSSGKGIKLDWTVWWVITGDKKIEKIDKKLGQRLLKISIKARCWGILGLVCILILLICFTYYIDKI